MKNILVNKKALGLFLVVFLCSCTNNNGDKTSSSIDSGSSETISTTYDEKVTAVSYNSVSFETYTTYYIDSIGGNDSNTGLNENDAFKSISKANSLILKTKENNPTRILFKAGSEFNEALNVVSFSASEDFPLVLDSYGTENNGYATFKASPYCVNISGDNVRISHFELTNINSDRGFNVYTSKAGATKNIVLKDNFIHDINFNFENGLPTSYQGKNNAPETIDISIVSPSDVTPNTRYIYQMGGIYFNAGTSSVTGPSWFENVYIENNKIEKVSRVGIFFDSQWVKRPGIDWGNNTYINDEKGWYPSKNVNIRNNKFNYTGGDAAVVLGCNGGVMEYNTCYNAQYLGRGGYYTAGLWIHSTINYVIQYNEAAYTHLLNGSGDGQGFDIDMSCKNIIFQYNYSHHNDGGGILLCTNSSPMTIYNEDGTPVRDDDGLPHREKRLIWGPVTIRNNVFADNGGATFETSDALNDLTIHNNTIVMPGESGNEKLIANGSFVNNVLGNNMKFFNNIVYLRKERNIDSGVSHFLNPAFSNNCFYHFNATSLEAFPLDDSNYFFDPKLTSEEAKSGYENAKEFMSQNSDILNKGKVLERMNKYDFNGKNCEEKLYLGAFCEVK